MEISAANSLANLPAVKGEAGAGGVGKTDFQEIMKKMGLERLEANYLDMKRDISTNSQIDPQKLLKYQTIAQEIHFVSELIAKVSESGAATLRRLQNAQ